MKVNALCTANVSVAKEYSDRLTACGVGCVADSKTVIYAPYTKETCQDIVGDIYLDSMLDEELFESACDYLFNSGARAIVRAAYELTECGIIEARYKLSPIMLLHKIGIIDRCAVAGGVCLDNDDLDLMAQERVPLILLPTSDAGYGHGYAPVCAALKRGLRVGLGTYDGKYNKNHDPDYEAEFLKLTANAEMRVENALDAAAIAKIMAFE